MQVERYNDHHGLPHQVSPIERMVCGGLAGLIAQTTTYVRLLIVVLPVCIICMYECMYVCMSIGILLLFPVILTYVPYMHRDTHL